MRYILHKKVLISLCCLLGTLVLYQNFTELSANTVGTTFTLTSDGRYVGNNFELIPIQHIDSHNATSLWQDPINPRLFWGRKTYHTPALAKNHPAQLGNEDPNDESTWNRWTLALYRLNEDSRTLELLRRVNDTGVVTISGEKNKMIAAYDPSVIVHNNKRYVAFECHGEYFGGSTYSCIGELSSSGKLIPSRTRAIVKGFSKDDATSNYFSSASVPKLLQLNGKTFLFWTAVKQNKQKTGIASFESLTSRGMEIIFNSKDQMWHPKTGQDPAFSDGLNTVRVYNWTAPEVTADLFSVYSLPGGKILTTAASGNCAGPIQCYGLSIRVGTLSNPLQPDFVNIQMSTIMKNLPPNTHEYFRPFKTVDGKLALLGKFLNPGNGNSKLVPQGMYIIRHRELEALSPSIQNPSAAQLAEGPNDNSASTLLAQRLYEGLLEKSPTTHELSSLKSLATQGLSCQTILEKFATSSFTDEHRLALKNEEVVVRLYRGLLGRNPESNNTLSQASQNLETYGYSHMVKFISQSQEAKNLCAQLGSLVTSSEKTWKRINPSLDRMLTRLYEEALGRTPSSSEVVSWKNDIATKKSICTTINKNIVNAMEFNNLQKNFGPANLVQRLFWAVLAREAPASAVTEYVALFNKSGLEAVRAAIVNSQEAANLCRAEGI